MLLAEAQGAHHCKLVSLLVDIGDHERVDDDRGEQEQEDDDQDVERREHLFENQVRLCIGGSGRDVLELSFVLWRSIHISHESGIYTVLQKEHALLEFLAR